MAFYIFFQLFLHSLAQYLLVAVADSDAQLGVEGAASRRSFNALELVETYIYFAVDGTTPQRDNIVVR